MTDNQGLVARVARWVLVPFAYLWLASTQLARFTRIRLPWLARAIVKLDRRRPRQGGPRRRIRPVGAADVIHQIGLLLAAFALRIAGLPDAGPLAGILELDEQLGSAPDLDDLAQQHQGTEPPTLDLD